MNAVLNWTRPPQFADLPQIAKVADSLEARLALDWLDDLTREPLSGADDAAVLVVEREPWLNGIKQSRERGKPFPDELVVATVIDVPSADRCLVVPTGGRQTGDTVMLYARRPRGDRVTLMPIAVTRHHHEAVAVLQPCQLSDTPNVDCFSSGCAGICELEYARERGALVKVGCSCN